MSLNRSRQKHKHDVNQVAGFPSKHTTNSGSSRVQPSARNNEVRQSVAPVFGSTAVALSAFNADVEDMIKQNQQKPLKVDPNLEPVTPSMTYSPPGSKKKVEIKSPTAQSSSSVNVVTGDDEVPKVQKVKGYTARREDNKRVIAEQNEVANLQRRFGN